MTYHKTKYDECKNERYFLYKNENKFVVSRMVYMIAIFTITGIYNYDQWKSLKFISNYKGDS